MHKKSNVLITALGLSTLLVSSVVSGAAGTISGKINGHGCAHEGHTCPVSTLDPHIALEPDFILQKSDGDYYFMTNLPRSTKVRYVLQDVTVSGEIDEQHKNILVDEFKVNGKVLWSQKMADEARENVYREGTYAF